MGRFLGHFLGHVLTPPSQSALGHLRLGKWRGIGVSFVSILDFERLSAMGAFELPSILDGNGFGAMGARDGHAAR